MPCCRKRSISKVGARAIRKVKKGALNEIKRTEIYRDFSARLVGRAFFSKTDPEISALAPAEIKFESTALIGNKRQAKKLILADRSIPTAVRIENIRRKFADAHKFFIRNSDDIMIEIMKGISQIPFEPPMFRLR